MKKIFTTLAVVAAAFVATTANAQNVDTYQDKLLINVYNMDLDPVDATVTIEHNEDGTSTFMLKDFNLNSLGIAVGDVVVEGIQGVADGDATVYDYKGEAKLPSDTELAVSLGHKVNLTLHGVAKDGKLYAEISLLVELEGNQLPVNCVFGTKIETSVNAIVVGKTAPVAVFNATGARQNGMQRGLNIVRTADGKTVKVLK